MKINKLQTGGNVYYSAIANPFATPKESTASSSKLTSGKSGLISDKLLDKLYEVGIPSDVDNFIKELSEYELKAQYGLGMSSSAIHALESKANKIIQNSKYLENAEKYSEKNDAIGEIAVGNYHGRGLLYVVDPENHDIKGIDIALYDQEKDGPAMTINELIEHRKYNPTQAFDSSLTRIINSNVGMSKINDYILGIIKTVGTSSTISEAYTDLASYIGKEAAKRPTQELLIGLLAMQRALEQIGPDAIFKNKSIMQSKNIQDAFSYIRSVLPKDMQVLLAGRYVANGGDISKANNYMQELIAQALLSSNDIKLENYLDYDASANKAAGTLAGLKELNRNLGVLELLVLGSLGKKDYLLISSKNPSASMTLHGTGIGNLASIDNDIVDKTTLSNALRAGLAPLIDLNHVTMGDQKITPELFDTILYNGGDVINIWAPMTSSGDIDFSLLEVFNEIQKRIELNPLLTVLDKNRLLAENNIEGYYDNSGTFHGQGNMGQFLVMTGLTSDEVIDPKTNMYADILPSSKKDVALKQIDRIYGQLNKGIKSKDAQYKFEKGWFDFTTDLVNAPIFMKLNDTAQIDAGTFSGKGPLVTTPSYQNQLAYDQMRYSRTNNRVITPSTQMLYDE